MQTPAKPRIVQSCREIAIGGGVSGVAAELEAGFLAAGYECSRLTLETVGLKPHRRRGSRMVNKLLLLRDVVWFSLAGTLYSKVRYSRRSDTVIISHNDVLHGDVYINHGLHKLLVKESPHPWRMVLRNPLHLFLLVREELRHGLRVHQHIVTLSSNDSAAIAKLYPSTASRITELANGVHLGRFARDPCDRERVRSANRVRDNLVLLFVGHEYHRKGLNLVIEALAHLDESVRLWVVGGTEGMIGQAGEVAARFGLADQVTFFGTVSKGIEDLFGAADMLVLPSEYEAAALVLLEAMAAGVVPVTTAVGAAPDLIRHGINGFLIDRDPASIATAVTQAADPVKLAELSKQAIETAQDYDWRNIVARYAQLIENINASRQTNR